MQLGLHGDNAIHSNGSSYSFFKYSSLLTVGFVGDQKIVEHQARSETRMTFRIKRSVLSTQLLVTATDYGPGLRGVAQLGPASGRSSYSLGLSHGVPTSLSLFYHRYIIQ